VDLGDGDTHGRELIPILWTWMMGTHPSRNIAVVTPTALLMPLVRKHKYIVVIFA